MTAPLLTGRPCTVWLMVEQGEDDEPAFNPEDYPKWLRDLFAAEGLPAESLRFVPLAPPTDEDVEQALKIAARRGFYDPHTKTFDWERRQW